MRALTPEVRRKAAQIQATLQAEVEAARRNADLSDAGRTNVIAQAEERAKTAMTQLRRAWSADNTQQGQTLAREIFGSVAANSSDAISIRDADDRVAQLKNAEQAGVLLRRAEDNGDQILSRAIALRAFNEAVHSPSFGVDTSPWREVLGTYLETRPQLAERVDELANIEGKPSAQRAMNQFMAFSVSVPAETANDRAARRDAEAKRSGAGNGWLVQ